MMDYFMDSCMAVLVRPSFLQSDYFILLLENIERIVDYFQKKK